ncbi:transcription factor [Dorcoceras hygrometricum]|uniref:Transcription factor n=1 Tax=Dorcoceras hygrometricum TaxID=472368 RepID=A0A2Z7B7A0_9LAMI|nr:transcription factor [Dorcoceras hygrometricum]
MSSNPPSEKPRTEECSYSKPEAEYQEILQNPDIFLQKLKAFHSFRGTKFRIPTMGGNRLDLHLLFVEVTSRGGIEKVLRDRRWKEITGAFKFPSSITNASFVLRKYYLSLLHHFEQIYYLRKEEPAIFVSASKSSNGFTLSHSLNGAAPNQFLANPTLDDSSIVTGAIDGKFDDGYLITVNLGSEEFKGVLYHIPTSPNTSQGVSISHDAEYHAHEKGIVDNIGKLLS